MDIKFGPAGLGEIKKAVNNLKYYSDLGLKACEISFAHGVYIRKKEDALKISVVAKKLKIILTIHAPYYINLNSKDKEKIKKSKERIIECCKVGTWLKASRVIFHAGFYSDLDKEKTFQNIKKHILEIKKEIKKLKYLPELCPEITGKVNVFGNIEEISKLCKETKIGFCIDYAHILARYKSYKPNLVNKSFKEFSKWHIHFSGIVYNEKGERHHRRPIETELKNFISILPKNKSLTIISESPNPIEDSLRLLKKYKILKNSTGCKDI